MRRFDVLKDYKAQEVGKCPVVCCTVGSKIYSIKGGRERREKGGNGVELFGRCDLIGYKIDRN
jgi:hypothetical protein